MGTSVLQLPLVQDAIGYALAQLETWQGVPARVEADQQAVVDCAAANQGDTAKMVRLTAFKQALDGVQVQYLESSANMASVLHTAQAMQTDGPVDAGSIADAGRLAGIISSGLATLAQIEQGMQQEGCAVTVGAGGVTGLPSWVLWALVGLGLVWAVTGRGRPQW